VIASLLAREMGVPVRPLIRHSQPPPRVEPTAVSRTPSRPDRAGGITSYLEHTEIAVKTPAR
jgi:hypothetical protein